MISYSKPLTSPTTGINCNSGKIRILHIIASPAIGGAEKLLLTLSKNLDRNKFDVILGIFIYENDNNDLMWQEAGKLDLTLEPIRIQCVYGLTQVLDLYGIIKKYRPDVIHTHGYKTNILGFVVARAFRIPIVTTFHGWLHSQNIATKLFFRVSTKLLSYFDLVITVSDQIKTRLIKMGVPSRKTTTVRNIPAIEADIYSRKKDAFRDEIGIPLGSRAVGFVGRLERVKGCHDFVHAASIVAKNDPNACFVIVGEGSERKSLEYQVRKLGIENRIYFCGFRHDTASVFAALDLYVLPSLSEGVPLTLLEAMSAGVPVIATCVGGVPEVIRHGVDGILVSPRAPQALAESIVESLTNRDRTSKRVLEAKKKIDKEYSVERWVDIIGGIYVELTNRY